MYLSIILGISKTLSTQLLFSSACSTSSSWIGAGRLLDVATTLSGESAGLFDLELSVSLTPRTPHAVDRTYTPLHSLSWLDFPRISSMLAIRSSKSSWSRCQRESHVVGRRLDLTFISLSLLLDLLRDSAPINEDV